MQDLYKNTINTIINELPVLKASDELEEWAKLFLEKQRERLPEEVFTDNLSGISGKSFESNYIKDDVLLQGDECGYGWSTNSNGLKLLIDVYSRNDEYLGFITLNWDRIRRYYEYDLKSDVIGPCWFVVDFS